MEPNDKVQPRLARFFKRPAEMSPEDLEFVTVQAVDSRHRRAVQAPGPEIEVLMVPVPLPLEHVEDALVAVHRAARGRLGQGRPAVPGPLKRGVGGSFDKSNRLESEVLRRRFDLQPHAGLKIMQFMMKERAKHADENSWRKQCLLKYKPLCWRQLQNVHSKGIGFWEAKVRDCSTGAGTRGSLNKRGQHLKQEHRWTGSKGVRASGAGRKDHFKNFKGALKKWAHMERGNGHAIDGHDMVEEFTFMLQKAIAYGDEMKTKNVLAAAGLALLLEYKGRVASLKKRDYRKNYIKELMKFCEVRSLKSQRMLKMSFAEEAIRCRLTWMQFDCRMWDLAFGGEEGLKKHVVDAAGVSKRIEDCVLCFSDQIPWWGLISRKKQLYLKSEIAGPHEGAAKSFTQLRGWDNEEAMKFRITVELRQVVMNYFKTGDNPEDPVGILGDTLLVVGGTWARLNNISADGKWLKTERFVVAGQEKVHYAGKSVGNVMQSWRDLRQKCPELFEGISVMQQPAAFVDSIITTWCIMEMAEKYPCMLWQRDLSGGGGFSFAAKQAMRIAGQVPAWVAGKMTAVLQITDTDFAHRVKAYSEQAKNDLRVMMQAAAAQSGSDTCDLKCGAYAILKVIAQSVKMLKETTVKENLVLAAGRRNAILAYRPDLKAGKLVDCSGQQWCKDLGKCGASHRLQRAWVENRMQWRDEAGKPLEPRWSDSTLAKTMEDMSDLCAVATALEVVPAADDAEQLQGPKVKVGSQEYEDIQLVLPFFDSIEENMQGDMERAIYLQLSPKDRLMQMQVDAQVMEEQKKKEESKSKVKNKVLEKALRGRAVAAAMTKWTGEKRKEMQADGVSRNQLLEQLVPAAGKGSKKIGDPGVKAIAEFLKLHKKFEVGLCRNEVCVRIVLRANGGRETLWGAQQ